MWAGAAAEMNRAAEEERPEIWYRWFRSWAGRALSVGGIRPVLATPLPPDAERARLVVSNHRSAADILLLLSLVGGQFLSRSDLADWPVIGPAAKNAQTLFVDRQSEHSGAAAIRLIRSRLKAKQSILVFPEGTTYCGDEVRPFRPGAFVAARGLEVEILPVGLAYPEGAEWWKQAFMSHLKVLSARPSTRVGVAVGEPLIPGREKTAELAERLRERVQELTHRARSELERIERERA